MIRLYVQNVCEQNVLVVHLKNAIHIKMSFVHVVSFPIENMTIAAINTIWLHPILEAKWCNNNNWKVRSFQRYIILIDAYFFLWENVPFRLNNRSFLIIVCYCTLRTKIILQLLSDFNLSNILSWVTIQRIGPHESQVQRYLTSSNQHWFFCHLENIQTANIHHKVDTFWYLKQKSSKLFVCRIKAKQSKANLTQPMSTEQFPSLKFRCIST